MALIQSLTFAMFYFGQPSASAVMIYKGEGSSIFITADHAILGEASITIGQTQKANNTACKAKTIYRDRTSDIALFEVKHNNFCNFPEMGKGFQVAAHRHNPMPGEVHYLLGRRSDNLVTTKVRTKVMLTRMTNPSKPKYNKVYLTYETYGDVTPGDSGGGCWGEFIEKRTAVLQGIIQSGLSERVNVDGKWSNLPNCAPITKSLKMVIATIVSHTEGVYKLRKQLGLKGIR